MNPGLRCIAVDDESLALDLLEDNISKVPFLQLVRRCRNAYEAMEVLQQENIDLIFLDIQMPGITGIQFLQSLGRKQPMIIFITAYDRFALEGFNLDVLDYLVKPVPFERFLKACNKALEQFNLRNKAIPSPAAENGSDYIFVNSEYNLVKIVISEITHVEGLKDYIKIHVSSSAKAVITRSSMKSIEEKLPAGKFVRVHKSFIVNIAHIASIRKNRIKIGETEIPVSDNYREELYKHIDGKNL
ncbi:MAG TPA: LytTR family DNA-binding domain-containing protein [Bacteroidia bacterium]